MHRFPYKPVTVLLAISIISMLLSLSSGSIRISPTLLWSILGGHEQGIASHIVLELRWPRTQTAFITGGLLGLAGALMQVLLRNPLADPYILGISGGAATAALTGITLGLSPEWMQVSTFSGALLSMLLVFLLSRQESGAHTHQLLLTGVVLAAGWGAMINILLILADSQSLHAMLFWLMGDLSHTTGSGYAYVSVLLVATAISWLLARDLNLLTQGELKARALGSPVKQVRWGIFVIASLCTAIAVSLAGSIGFVGLIIPHILRRLIGSNHRLLLPASVLAGGSLLTLADTGARTLLAPQQLPVGVITALIGVPVFLYLLHKH